MQRPADTRRQSERIGVQLVDLVEHAFQPGGAWIGFQFLPRDDVAACCFLLCRDQPDGESIAIRSRRFTKPQFLADLCAVQFNGVALPVVLAKEG
jgi:hypothetical protein